MNTFETFNNGKLITPASTKDFSNIPWREHPNFTGVELKHILTSEEINGAYSYHLVRIAPNCSIGEHIHETQLETHEVIAGNGTCINESTAITYEPGVTPYHAPKIPEAYIFVNQYIHRRGCWNN